MTNPARKIKRSAVKNILIFPAVTANGGGCILLESILESKFCLHLEFNPQVITYFPQPKTFKIKQKSCNDVITYTPDLSDNSFIEGTILEFTETQPLKIVIIRKIKGNEVSALDIVQGRTEQFKLHDLTEMHSLGSVKCLSESRELGDLVFYDLSVKEQSETLRRLNYINKLKDREVRFITVKTESVIKEIALEMNEKPPHWQTIRNWIKCFEKSGGRIKSLYPKHRLKGARGDKLDPHVVDIINKEIKVFFNLSQPSLATIARNVEIEVSRYNIQNPDNPITTPSYVTIRSRANRELFKNKKRLGKRKL